MTRYRTIVADPLVGRSGTEAGAGERQVKSGGGAPRETEPVDSVARDVLGVRPASVAPSGYRTIVADPPWPYPDDKRGWGAGVGPKAWRGGDRTRIKMPYPSMTLEAIRSLPVSALASESSHLYLWTTNRHLHEAFHVAEAWGFRHAQTLVWTKIAQGSFLGGAFGANVEFVLFCRRGVLATTSSSATAWFQWPRVGAGSHSRKPEAFLDLVESVSPGPYLEMFARRQRLGWDTWGDEALNHVEIGGAA